ncbi:hypothetical protein GCM10010435_68390 [Winogradskya consettensis]|uniref:Uncharacterized protein n=1 Tax=Winogradskya consettensis TaxID=113560 RepID=A0A919SL00_9ACTN|nr:hypothetical protein Aco04nite_36380 [Actinoplanes consettensis]
MRSWNTPRGGGDVVYGLGLIGALIHYLTEANAFWPALLGVLKALIWPVFLVQSLL